MNPLPVPAITALALGVTVLLFYLLNMNQIEHDAQAQAPDTAQGFVPSPEVRTFAEAIAFAEGYSNAFGSPLTQNVPFRAHNPGDLKIPNWAGTSIDNGISVFSPDSNDAEGWGRLYFQLQLIVDGQSKVYSPSMTISQMAAKWTFTDQTAWAANVAKFLATNPNAVIGPLLSPSLSGIVS